MIEIRNYVAEWSNSPFSAPDCSVWQLPGRLEKVVSELIGALGSEYLVTGSGAIHRSAVVEDGATLKGPIIVGPDCSIGAGAYLRGGVFLDQGVVLGPGVEIKSSLVFANTRVAHFNFVGDSILGAHVNLEAGAIVANYRNEAPGRNIRILLKDAIIDTGTEKFGAIIGDGARIGANAVIAPGAVLAPGQVVSRLGLIDQSPLPAE